MTIRLRFAAAWVLGTGLLCAVGCQSDLPAYPVMDEREALTTIADRQASVKSVSAECDLDLTDAEGQSVSLDGVLVAEGADRLRLRAWKFGQAVFDLTLVDGKGWVVVPTEGPAAGKVDVQKMPARRVSDAFALLGPGFFRRAAVVSGDATVIRARGPALGRDDVECEIDRASLTARRFTVAGGGEAGPSELQLDRYTVTQAGIVWPMRMRLKSPAGEVTVRVREVELNGEVPSSAFVPPQRATALP